MGKKLRTDGSASKRAAPKKAAPLAKPTRPKARTARAKPSDRLESGRIVPPHPAPPVELAGKWVAWSRDRRIVAHGDTLATVMESVASEGIKGASYQRLPGLVRGH